MPKEQDWYEAKAKIRVTEVTFTFKDTVFDVKGMIDFQGPNGSDGIVSKEFRHRYFGFGEDVDTLHKILEAKCGEDLFGKRQTNLNNAAL